MTKRKMKIQRKYTYNKTFRNYPKIGPSIRLQGDWLSQAGFSSGQTINIEIHEKMLVITI
jgi:hypothetical protein